MRAFFLLCLLVLSAAWAGCTTQAAPESTSPPTVSLDIAFAQTGVYVTLHEAEAGTAVPVSAAAYNVTQEAWMSAPARVDPAAIGGFPVPTAAALGRATGPDRTQGVTLLVTLSDVRSVAVNVPHANLTVAFDVERFIRGLEGGAAPSSPEALANGWARVGERGWSDQQDPESWFAHAWVPVETRLENDAFVTTLTVPAPPHD